MGIEQNRDVGQNLKTPRRELYQVVFLLSDQIPRGAVLAKPFPRSLLCHIHSVLDSLGIMSTLFSIIGGPVSYANS